MIVTVTTYCGNLVAFLTFPTIEYPISDLNTLVEKLPNDPRTQKTAATRNQRLFHRV